VGQVLVRDVSLKAGACLALDPPARPL
jgi:hypothetical protein